MSTPSTARTATQPALPPDGDVSDASEAAAIALAQAALTGLEDLAAGNLLGEPELDRACDFRCP